MIPVTQKAPNTCTYCRTRKQRCDRELPSCSRCASKLRICDYSWLRDASRSNEPEGLEIGPLFTDGGACGPELSPRGRDELLQAMTACTTRKPGSMSTLTELVFGILEQANTTITTIMEQHASSIHHWCPLISEEMLRCGRDGAFEDALPKSLLSHILILCIFLLTRRTCQHREHVTTGVLYATMKQAIALLRAAGDASLDLFRAEMLLVVYEYAHGMAKQAHVTLSSCVALLALIELDMRAAGNEVRDEVLLAPLRANVIMLDRMIPLATLSMSLPLAVPSKYPLSQSVASRLGARIPPPSLALPATSPRQVHIRTMIALFCGRVLEYIHDLHNRNDSNETYDEIDAAGASLIKTLLKKPQPYTWLHCEAIAMAFCSYLLLQQVRVQYLESKRLDSSHPDATKALIALHYARRMAWDMVQESIQKVRMEEDLDRLPFARLSFAIRAAIAVFEMKDYGGEVECSDADLRGFSRVVELFAARWSVGVDYAKRLEQCFGAC